MKKQITTSDQLILLDDSDNVLVARKEIMAGTLLSISGMQIKVTQNIKLGFKMAAKNIVPDEQIIKYGTPIGVATTSIKLGEIVHIHNMKSNYSPTYTIQNQKDYEKL